MEIRICLELNGLKLHIEIGEGNSLAVQWLALSDLTAGALGSILGWEIKIPQALRCKVLEDKKSNHKGK